MSKVIQQIHLASGMDVYLSGYDKDNNIIRYYTSNDFREISEGVKIEDGKVMASDFWFSEGFLQKFVEENDD